jgi:Methyltransferase domain
MNLFSRYFREGFFRRLRRRVLPNLQYLPRTRIRRCRACQTTSLFVQFGADEEFRFCLLCTANLRYEMLCEYIRDTYTLEKLDILELDPASPLQSLLSRGRTYTRTFFRPNLERGSMGEDGARVEDITALTLKGESLDLIVSADVLEHVPDAPAAFSESYRVLRPGGSHVFTVPNEAKTIRRAVVENGEVRHLAKPEYHSDPLDPNGILAFWHYGPDMQEQFGDCGLKFAIVKGPEGDRRSIVWVAAKPQSPPPAG